MAFSMLVSSTIAPLAASKSYASADVEQNTSIMNESTNEIKDDEKPAETSDTPLDIPEKTEEQQSEIQVEREEETNKEATSDTPQIETEEIEEKEKIVKKSDSATLYEDSSYTKLSSEDIDIKITGNMPENGTIKAYEIQNAITDMEKENVLAFGFEIYDKDDSLYDKNPNDEYKIEIKSSKLRDLDKIYFYEKDEEDLRFNEINDFSKLSNQIKLDSKADEFAIAKNIEKEEETLPNQTKDDEVKSPFITNQDNKEELNNDLSKDKEVEDPKDILDSLTSSLNQKEIPATNNEEKTKNENPNPTNNLELIDWKKDLLDVIAGNLKADKADKEETIEKSSDTEEDSESKNKSEELPKGENSEEIKDEAESKEEDSKENPQSTIDNESESKEDYEESEEKSETNKIEEETEEKLTYQQVLADIYTDKTYSQKSNDGTRIKLSGNLPGYTKVKAYPVEIKIEGQEVLAAYDITIFDEDDNEYKVSERNDINVQITNQKIKEAKEVEIYHKENEAAPEEKVEVKNKNSDTVTFKADSFSIYAVTDAPETIDFKFILEERDENGSIKYDSSGNPIINEVVSIQTIADGQTLIQPESPIFSNLGKFVGWFPEEHRGEANYKVEFNKPINFKEEFGDNPPEEINYVAHYEDVIYIDFIDRKFVTKEDIDSGRYKPDSGVDLGYENGYAIDTNITNGDNRLVRNEIIKTREQAYGKRIGPVEVPLVTTTDRNEAVFSHWSLTPGGEPFDPASTETDDNIVDRELIEKQNKLLGRDNKQYVRLDLYAVYKKDGHYVYFDSQGGSHINRQIVNDGERVKEPSDPPQRPGHEFLYWATDKEGKNRFDFNSNSNKITKNTTLYAIYSAHEVKYTIRHLTEDSSNGQLKSIGTETRYAVPGTFTKSGEYFREASNSEIAAKLIEDNYVKPGLNVASDKPKIVEGDGSTILDVYWYQRDKQLSFKTVGPTIFDPVFPIPNGIFRVKPGTDITSYINQMSARQKDGYWILREAPHDGRIVQTPYIMPNRDLDLFFQETTLIDRLRYWNLFVVEKDTNKQIARITKEENPKNVRYTRETFNQEGLKGFTYVGNDNQPQGVNYGVPRTDNKGLYNLTVYVTRNKYNLNFITNSDEFKDRNYKEIPYQKNVKDYVPKELIAGQTRNSQNHLFMGWYENPQFKGLPVNFNTKENQGQFVTMPNYDVTLYAKWDTNQHTVRAYKEMVTSPSTATSDMYTEFFVDHNHRIDESRLEAINPPTNKAVVRWYTFYDGDFQPYDFREPVTENIVLYPVWSESIDEEGTNSKPLEITHKVSYYGGEGTGKYIDPNEYSNNARVILMPPYIDGVYIGNLKPPLDSSGEPKLFQGWTLDKENNGHVYQPGDVYDIKEDTVFYAKWGKYKKIGLVFEEQRPDNSQKTVEDIPKTLQFTEITLPKPKDAVGYAFKGWSTTSDGNGKVYQPEEKIVLEKNKNQNNIEIDTDDKLYGIWEKHSNIITIKNEVIGDIPNTDIPFRITYTDKDGNVQTENININNNSSDRVPVPFGSTNISITALSSYRTKYIYDETEYDDVTLRLDSLDNDVSVTFVSEPYVVPTGLIDNFTPMALMLALASMAFAYRLYKRNKLAGGIDEWIRKSWRFFKQS